MKYKSLYNFVLLVYPYYKVFIYIRYLFYLNIIKCLLRT